jgi:hypothetical protein
MTLYSAFICWLILNELVALAIFGTGPLPSRVQPQTIFE